MSSLGLASGTWPGAAAFSTLREDAVSADGTHVPMVVLLPRGGKPAHPVPTFLEGYAGYGVMTLSPWYSPNFLAWLDHGGAFAFCGTRGGGERGRAWHEGGRSANKPAAQADFIACAERLEAIGYREPAHARRDGTSAGGTLVPGAVLRRPELFSALLSRVAMVNVTRLEVAENGANQYAEFGDPRTEDGFKALVAQDAYLMLPTGAQRARHAADHRPERQARRAVDERQVRGAGGCALRGPQPGAGARGRGGRARHRLGARPADRGMGRRVRVRVGSGDAALRVLAVR